MNDQANRLRKLTGDIISRENPDKESEKKNLRDTKIYSIVSGKGGVGKTNFSINLAIKLQQSGKKVLILDADIGMSNANILLGVAASKNLEEVINGNSSFRDIIIEGPEGINLICGGMNLFLIENLHESEQIKIIKDLEELGDYDIIIIDNGAGMNKHSLTFSSFADEIILVTTPEPTALTDAYRILKANSLYNVKPKANVVINQIIEVGQGEESFNKLKNTCQNFLDMELNSLGFIFNDVRVNKSIMEQNPLVVKYPKALASENIGNIANKILGINSDMKNTTNLKKLSNRLIKFFG